MVGEGATGAPGTIPGWWFIIILRSRSIEATRGIPVACSALGSAPWFAVAAACAAAARFCCDPTCAMFEKNCSNSACDGVLPRRHKLPTMSSTEAVRSNGIASEAFFNANVFHACARGHQLTYVRRSEPSNALSHPSHACEHGDRGGDLGSRAEVRAGDGRVALNSQEKKSRQKPNAFHLRPHEHLKILTRHAVRSFLILNSELVMVYRPLFLGPIRGHPRSAQFCG